MRGAQHADPSCGLPPAAIIIAASVNNKLADLTDAISFETEVSQLWQRLHDDGNASAT